jgi:hypothetical protein
MQVFISGSGERGHAVAIALETFIGDIFHSLTFFISDKDITSGERWEERLQKELQESQYGILCITHDNKDKPWLLFEAGALSNSSHKIPVVPFLFDIEPSELTGSPLLQFQVTIYNNKENVKKLIVDINNVCGDDKLDSARLDRYFERCYGEFEATLKQITPETEKPQDTESDKTRAILEEVLDLVRGNQRLLNNASNNLETIEHRRELNNGPYSRIIKKADYLSERNNQKLYAKMLEESATDFKTPIDLGVFKDEMPQFYDEAIKFTNMMKLDISFERKQHAFSVFRAIVEYECAKFYLSREDDDENEYNTQGGALMLLSDYLAHYAVFMDNTND